MFGRHAYQISKRALAASAGMQRLRQAERECRSGASGDARGLGACGASIVRSGGKITTGLHALAQLRRQTELSAV